MFSYVVESQGFNDGLWRATSTHDSLNEAQKEVFKVGKKSPRVAHRIIQVLFTLGATA